jgi:hypothetical protein
VVEVLAPIDACEHIIVSTKAAPPLNDLVFECEKCGKQVVIEKLAVMQCQGNLALALNGILTMAYGEPWKEKAMKKLEEVKLGDDNQ